MKIPASAAGRRHERTINKLLIELPGKLQRIGIAADHGGYELKKYLAGKLRDAVQELETNFERRKY